MSEKTSHRVAIFLVSALELCELRNSDMPRRTTADGFLPLAVVLIRLMQLASLAPTCVAIHEHLCSKDDFTNDLPIFIEKRTICNYDTVPVLVYPIKTTPDTDYEIQLCLTGE